MKSAASVSDLPFWDILSEEHQALLLNEARVYRLPSNAMVYDATIDPRYLRIVLSGKVKICRSVEYNREIILKIVTDGQITSFQPLFETKDESIYAETISPCTIVQIKAELIEDLIEEEPRFARYFFQRISSSYNKAIDRFVRVHPTVFIRKQICDLLVELSEDLGKRVGEETLIEHGLSHRQLATMIHRTRQSVTMVLSEMKKADLINYTRKSILIRDLDELRKWGDQEIASK